MTEQKKFKHLNIRSTEHLALLLGTDVNELLRICEGLDKNANNFYRRSIIRKKGKKPRPSAKPLGRFGSINKRLHSYLQRLEFPESMHGGLKGKSTFSYALPHLRKNLILKFDIKDCFPNINRHMVYRAFKRLGCAPDVCKYLTRLTTLDNQLPQGSPTSMIVANIVSTNLAIRLDKLAKIIGANFGSYVDDITLSGPVYIRKIKSLVLRIMRQEGFTPNEEKTEILFNNKEEQVIAGNRVNNGFDIPSKKVLEVKNLIEELANTLKSGKRPQPRQLSSIEGKIIYVRRLNKGVAKYLSKQLGKALELFCHNQLNGVSKQRNQNGRSRKFINFLPLPRS